MSSNGGLETCDPSAQLDHVLMHVIETALEGVNVGRRRHALQAERRLESLQARMYLRAARLAATSG